MKSIVLLALTLFPIAGRSQEQTTDFPKGADWPTITRPSGSIIAASSHTDYDEFAVPMARFDGEKFSKTISATGSVDYLVYSGAPSTSTLQNMAQITAQLTSEGYKPIFSCMREACGGFQFSNALASPLYNTLDGTGYRNFTVATFGAVTGDVRYTAFQRDSEFLAVLTTLAPGKHSGVLLIDVGGKNPVAGAAVPPDSDPGNGGSAQTVQATPASRIRSRLGTLMKPSH